MEVKLKMLLQLEAKCRVRQIRLIIHRGSLREELQEPLLEDRFHSIDLNNELERIISRSILLVRLMQIQRWFQSTRQELLTTTNKCM